MSAFRALEPAWPEWNLRLNPTTHDSITRVLPQASKSLMSEGRSLYRHSIWGLVRYLPVGTPNSMFATHSPAAAYLLQSRNFPSNLSLRVVPIP